MQYRKKIGTRRDRETVGSFRAQHLSLGVQSIPTRNGRTDVMIDEAESPLAWLARRKGRDGKPLIRPVQFLAGERLRSDFTRAQMTPRVTSSWDANAALGRGNQGGMTFSDISVAAHEQFSRALHAVGPEFAGLLTDVCCFLKRLEDVEHERGWPLRSAKVVLQLALDRLARHYGLGEQARGRAHAPIRAWAETDSSLVSER